MGWATLLFTVSYRVYVLDCTQIICQKLPSFSSLCVYSLQCVAHQPVCVSCLRVKKVPVLNSLVLCIHVSTHKEGDLHNRVPVQVTCRHIDTQIHRHTDT